MGDLLPPGMKVPSLFTTQLVVINAVFPTLATVAVGLRFYARNSRTGKSFVIFSDDWLALASLFFSWAKTANTFVGAGQAGIDLQRVKTQADIMTATVATVRTLWIEGFLLATTLALIKLTILQFYYRIFATKASRIFRWACFVTYGLVTSWWLSSIVCQFLVTDPMSAAYHPSFTAPIKYRYNYNDWTLSFAAISLFFDVAILCFPLPMIKSLHIDFKRKMSVMAIFWLGAFCCVAAAVRLYYLHKEISKVTDSSPTANPYANATKMFIWAHVEPNCSIIAACLPTYGALFHNGRAAHSLIRSLRSALSLGSTKVGSTNDASKFTKGESQHSLTHSSTHAAGYYELREASVENGQQAWVKSGEGPRVEVTTAPDLEAQRLPRQNRGISVTRTTELTRDGN